MGEMLKWCSFWYLVMKLEKLAILECLEHQYCQYLLCVSIISMIALHSPPTQTLVVD